jgi:hypothetical protein
MPPARLAFSDGGLLELIDMVVSLDRRHAVAKKQRKAEANRIGLGEPVHHLSDITRLFVTIGQSGTITHDVVSVTD